MLGAPSDGRAAIGDDTVREVVMTSLSVVWWSRRPVELPGVVAGATGG